MSLSHDLAPLRNRRILVTGHTGFTGTWACHWLAKLGAEVYGLALPPETDPNAFTATDLEIRLAQHLIGDITRWEVVERCFQVVQPELVLHLAAQPLVRRSYAHPVLTFATNVIGTVHILEAARNCAATVGVVAITTDKVYENTQQGHSYRETDRLGGQDPYSASKAGAELALKSYRDSQPSWQQKLTIAVARGGNIIGGGDWSEDRLIPDFVRAAASGRALTIRNPQATRPWQHILCLVHGYLLLLSGVLTKPNIVATAWNFGPSVEDCVSVRNVLERMQALWTPIQIDHHPAIESESQTLIINSDKARKELNWTPAWSLEQAIKETTTWYRKYYSNPRDAGVLTISQIDRYCSHHEHFQKV